MEQPFRRKSLRYRIPRLQNIPGTRSPKGWGMPKMAFRSRSFIPRNPTTWWLKDYPDGSAPEWLVFNALLRMGMKNNQDFIFKTEMFGIRLDFYLPQQNIAILVVSEEKRDPDKKQIEPLTEARLRTLGIRVVYIDEQELYADPITAVRNALGRI